MVAALIALLGLGSCGLAYGAYRATQGGGGTTVTIASPAPASPSPTAGASASPTTVAGVDLAVTELTGTQVSVQNLGSAAAGRFVISVAGTAFLVDGGLAPGASAHFGFACKQGPLTAVVDSTEAVEEADESNNVLTAGPFDCSSPSPSPSVSPSVSPTVSPSVSPSEGPTPAPKLPDLVVRQVTSDQVVVANVGDKAAGTFVVIVGKVGTFTVEGLAAGSSQTLTFPCTDGSLTATADANDRVTESNEGNNSATGGPFDCLPDLVVTRIGVDSVTIANQGVGDAGSSLLGLNGQTFNVPGIAAGDNVTIGYPCFGGTIQAIADLLDDVIESNEGNNASTTDVGTCP
jgi:hypothetical protein